MGVVKALDLVPKKLKLLLTIGTDLVNVGRVINALSADEDGHVQALDAVVRYRLVLPSGYGVEKKERLLLVDDLIGKREIVGNGELTFYGCDKRVWFSRAYFKLLQYKLDEMRN